MNSIQVVLADTKDSGNIGAVCRCMKNMEVRRLVLVGDRPYDDRRVVTLAVHAADVYTDAVRYPDLKSAVADSIITVGVTRRRGRWRKFRSFTPEELARKLIDFGEGTVSLVFGNEEHGLTDGELEACDTAVHIPASPEFPSLNLSHAVQIILYVIYRELQQVKVGEPSRELRDPGDNGEADDGTAGTTREAVERAVSGIADDLEAIGFFTLTGREEMHLFLRDILARAHPGEKEVERFAKLFSKIRDLKIHRPE